MIGRTASRLCVVFAAAVVLIANGACSSGAECGDGVVAPPEQCDDGNDIDDDACTRLCLLPSCGDGIVQTGEECDDGNADDGDGCLPSCLAARCGDGFVERAAEECDDGNFDDNDACLNGCEQAACGDGVVRLGFEACDDGNDIDDDACRNDCALATCGDGAVQAPEECDDGDADDRDACTSRCLDARCGDGFVRTGVEECDDGNQRGGDGCSSICELLPSCGNGILEDREVCDDGNADDTDACLNTCRPASCGDGFLFYGVEACDDGNRRDGDACPSTCQLAACGDGFVLDGFEECDDGNDVDTDSCLAGCRRARCGDGVVQAGVEQCDDGNTDNLDGCLVDCRDFDLCVDFVIDAVEPPRACFGTVPATLTLRGSGFLRVAGVTPAVLFDGSPVTVTSMGGCVDVLGAFARIERCDSVTIALPPPPGGTPPGERLSAGSYDIEVDNPITTACTAFAVFGVGNRPVLTSVAPSRVCEGRPTTFTLRGTDFVPTTDVLFDGIVPTMVTFVDDTELRATFAAGLSPGSYTVTVSNGASCSSSLAAAVTVLANPIVFFVDPEVIYNGIDIVATIYLSGLNGGDVMSVSIRPTGTVVPPTLLTHRFDPTRPNQVQADVTRGLTPGAFDVLVVDAEGCRGVLPGGFSATGTLSVSLTGIEPPFGWTGSATGVSVTAGAPGFQNGVRVYLSPVGGGFAMPLTAVGFLDSGEVTGVVPSGLVAGIYDVVVVNPDGSVGVLPGGFEVTVLPPPVIESISPGSIPNSSVETVVVRGAGFDVAVEVTLSCEDPGGVVTGPIPVAETFFDSGHVDVDVTAGLAAGSVCIVRATNPDGSYGEFSALGITNPAENISAPTAATDMLVARRSPATTNGRATRTARFLYAIGGDDAGGALASVEVAALGRFGDVQPWRAVPRTPVGDPIPDTLAPARTRAEAVTLGRFVYLIGGSDGAIPTVTVHRAEVLRPSDAPDIIDVFLEVEPVGVGVGLWYYRVSAVMAASDPDNPDGETLPSDPQPIRVPPSIPGLLHVNLTWSAVPGAASYRVYRSPVPGLAAGNEELLAVVPAASTTFEDIGGATTSEIPRALGDLGTWAVMPALLIPREGLGVGLAAEPDPAGAGVPAGVDRHYLYVLLGRSLAGALPLTYERLQVDVDGDGGHTVAGAWLPDVANPLSAGRWQAAGYTVDRVATTRIASDTDTWIYGGAGANAAVSALITNVDAALVLSGGALSTWSTVDSLTGRAGYGYAAAANQLFAFGGRAAPASSVVSAEICGIGLSCGGGGPDPPDLRNWNAAGVSLVIPRYLMGSAVESGHIYLLGGETTGGVPTRAVESFVW